MRKRIQALLMAIAVLLAFAIPSFATVAAPATINKTVEAYNVQQGLYDVTLSVTGSDKAVNKPVDVVLVIDASTSMTNGGSTRLAEAKAAATSFAAIALQDNSANRIAVVKYNIVANTVLGFSSNITDLTQAISNITTYNYTNIKAGFDAAYTIMDGRTPDEKAARNAAVILLSDGDANLGGSGFGSNRISDAQAAINAGQAFRTGGGAAKVYTIGFHVQPNSNAENTLVKAAEGNGGYYSASSSDKLNEIYNSLIIGSLNAAVENASVVDYVTPNFEIVSIGTPTQGTASTSSALAINWTAIGSLGANQTATLKYRIRLIDNWSDTQGDSGANDRKLDTNVSAVLTYDGGTQTFPVPYINYWDLTTDVLPAGAGNVTVSLNGNVTPMRHFADNVQVVVNQTAADNYHFVEWTGAAATTESSVTLIMNANRCITANFAPDEINPVTWQLTTETTGSGIGTIAPSNGTYDDGDEVTLTATAYPGSVFTGWAVDGESSGSEPTLNITMNSDHHVVATFVLDEQEPEFWTLTTNTEGTGSGTIDVNPANEGSSYEDGTEVTLTAAADPGSVFAGWTGAVVSNSPEITIIMDSHKSVTAYFNTIVQPTPTPTPTPTPAPTEEPVRESVVLTTGVSGQGSILPGPGTTQYYKGTSVQLKPTPAAGWEFSGWSGDSVDANNQIYMDANKSVTAIFKEISVTIEDEETAEAPAVVTPTTEPKEDETAEEVTEEEVPAAPATLPKTGGVPAGIFYGLGGLVTAAGVILRRKLK